MYKAFTWHVVVLGIEGGTGNLLVVTVLTHTLVVMIVLKEKKRYSQQVTFPITC